MRANRDAWGNWLPEVAAQRKAASKAAKRAERKAWFVGVHPNPMRAIKRAGGVSPRQWKRRRSADLRAIRDAA